MSAPVKQKPVMRLTPARVALLYAVFAALWILISGYLLNVAVDDPTLMSRIELAKGLAFVAVTSGLLYLILKGWKETYATVPAALREMDTPAPNAGRTVLLFVVLALVVPLIDFVVYSIHVPQAERSAYETLQSTAALKTGELEYWLSERRGDAEGLMGNKAFSGEVGLFLSRRDAGSRELTHILNDLDMLRTSHGYDSVLLLDPGGKLITSVGNNPGLPPLIMDRVHQSVRDGKIQFSGLYRNETGIIFLDWVVPVTRSDPPGKRQVAVLVLRVSPEQFLFPLLNGFPTSSGSGEIQLVRRDGNTIQFLNQPGWSSTPMATRGDLTGPLSPSAQAILDNKPGITRGTDLRNVQVLTAYRPVAGTDWHLIARVDRDEVLKPVWTLLSWVSVITAMAIASIMAVMLMFVRQQQRAHQLALQARSLEAVKESELRYRTLVGTIPDLVWLKDRNGIYLNCNRQFERLFGAREADIIGKSDYDFVDRELADSFREHDRQAEEAGEPSVKEEWLTFADNGYRGLFETVKAPLRDDQGNLMGVLGIARDITERKQAEQKLAESEEHFRSLFENMLDGYAYCRMDYQQGVAEDFEFIEVNQVFETLIGLQDVSGKRVGEIIPGIRESNPELFEIFGRVAMSGQPERFETYVNGLGKWFSIVVYSPQQEYFVAVFDNITERKRAEESLRKLSQAVEQSPSTIVVTDLDATIEYANATFVKESGYSLDEALGSNPRLLHSGKTPKATYDDMWAHLTRGQAWQGEFINRRKDGSEYLELALISPVFQADGRKTHYLAIKENITERRAAELRIQRLTQLYSALSQCNEAIVRCTSEEELFPQICRDAVQFGGMKMAWIGMLDQASKRVVPVASFGDGTEFLDGIQVSVDAGDPFGRGPTGTAIRDNRPYWNQDFQLDPNTAPWRERRKQYRWMASAALPLLRNGTPVGSLTLYSDTLNAFDEEARRLLTEMATDISFALDNFARETQRKQAGQALADSEQRFRGLVEQSLAGIFIIQDGKLAYVNPRCAEILGLGSADEMIGKELSQYVVEAERGRLMEHIRQIINKEVPSIASEYSLLRQDGVTITVGANASLATYHGQPAIIGLAQDISEKKRDEQRILNYVAQLKANFLGTVQMATSLSEMRDPYTAGHERRVAEIAVAIAAELGWDEQRIEGLKIAGYLHDIGKISIPAEILVKPGRLTATEFALVQGHAQASYDVLKHVGFPWPVADVALQHHERIDGSGYPNGLKGDEILLESRIMAVADVVEAMASHRPYRAGLGIESALAEIERGRGTSYDATVVDACLLLFRERGFVLPAY